MEHPGYCVCVCVCVSDIGQYPTADLVHDLPAQLGVQPQALKVFCARACADMGRKAVSGKFRRWSSSKRHSNATVKVAKLLWELTIQASRVLGRTTNAAMGGPHREPS